MAKRIRALPVDLRPREKLLRIGPEALTERELLAVLLITGTAKRPIFGIADDILSLWKKKKHLSHLDLMSLGIGPAKTAQVLALQEFTQRRQPSAHMSLTTGQDVFLHTQDILHEQKETLVCFYLNARSEVLSRETIAVGSLNTAAVTPATIFSFIKSMPVSDIILVHNHPSGLLEASRDDILFTKRIEQAAQIVGVRLLDHLIITRTGWVAIKD